MPETGMVLAALGAGLVFIFIIPAAVLSQVAQARGLSGAYWLWAALGWIGLLVGLVHLMAMPAQPVKPKAAHRVERPPPATTSKSAPAPLPAKTIERIQRDHDRETARHAQERRAGR